jgi:lipopolysaccharide export LptBFGC system permease protein LptF
MKPPGIVYPLLAIALTLLMIPMVRRFDEDDREAVELAFTLLITGGAWLAVKVVERRARKGRD